MSELRAAGAVLRKDLRLAWRDRGGWLSAGAFAALSVLVYSFAFDLASREVRPLLPGVLWTTFLFAGIFAGSHSFEREAEQGTFDAMLLSPASPTAIYLGKLLSTFAALLVVEFALLLMASILFDAALITGELLLIVAVGTAGYVSLTTLLSTLGPSVERSARARGVLLPSLALPLLVPLLIAAVRATGASLGEPTGTAPWMMLLAVFTLWSSLGAALLFPMAVQR
jgi:heme exporter protein B